MTGGGGLMRDTTLLAAMASWKMMTVPRDLASRFESERGSSSMDSISETWPTALPQASSTAEPLDPGAHSVLTSIHTGASAMAFALAAGERAIFALAFGLSFAVSLPFSLS